MLVLNSIKFSKAVVQIVKIKSRRIGQLNIPHLSFISPRVNAAKHCFAVYYCTLKANKQTNDFTALSIKALHTIAVEAFAGQENIFNQLFAFLLLVPVSFLSNNQTWPTIITTIAEKTSSQFVSETLSTM